ncbi:helix-turn-helix domain-containing protein [uncultured Nocardioides sp.]|uniref:helix-turn-helix domain-containing protein n=1 Tax=uncultured Nocardioides sp. TaxID=198441 RepID=UPI002619EF8F|nr:helix-turn-helix domain-containing protein [uncultured Nocardioides sp.]HRD60237.1 helix-turn-helix domain-containing protein [Nocardioides sp.]
MTAPSPPRPDAAAKPSRQAPRSRSEGLRSGTWATVTTPGDLGQFLTRVRVAAGWTQRDLAQHLGFPVRYLHEIEAGKDTLAYARLFALLRTLDIDLQLSSGTTAASISGSRVVAPPSTPAGRVDVDVEDWDF